MIFPICSLVSISVWASAACFREKVVYTTGDIFPVPISGHTTFFRALPTSPLRYIDKGLNVEPLKVSRFSITGMKLISNLAPLRKAIDMWRPSIPNALMFWLM